MLFVPSTGGISHAPQEHTPDELLVTGCQTLLTGVVAACQALLGVVTLAAPPPEGAPR